MKTKRKNRKMIAPLIWIILFTIVILGQAAAIWWALSNEESPLILRIVVFIIPLLLVGALIAVYIERVRELKSGMEDDLDKY